jgi:hypothetical protein
VLLGGQEIILRGLLIVTRIVEVSLPGRRWGTGKALSGAVVSKAEAVAKF